MRYLLLIIGVVVGPLTASAVELPDFTELVAEHSAAVVNISTTQAPRTQQRSQRRAPSLEDFFRRTPPGQSPRSFGPRRSLGSGFIISSDGYILTNNHVVDNADEIVVRLSDRRELEATLVGADSRSDLALLKVDATGLPSVKLGDSDKLKVGEWVLAIGSPFGFDYSVTAGIVSAKGRSLRNENNENYVPFIQTDVAINPGNSGGPLFNLAGEVVGINSQIYTRSGGFMGVSFAIPIDVAIDVTEQIKANGFVSWGWLGVSIQEINRGLAEGFGLDRPHGALVAEVLSGGPAESGGIHAGDIIVKFNDQSVELSSDLPHLVGRARGGSVAKVTVMREGEITNIDVVLGSLDSDGNQQASLDAPNASDEALLGLVVGALDSEMKDRYEIESGVQVLSVSGAASDAGIRRGDVIIMLNHKKLENPGDFREVAQSLIAGKSVPLYINRQGTATYIPLRVPG